MGFFLFAGIIIIIAVIFASGERVPGEHQSFRISIPAPAIPKPKPSPYRKKQYFLTKAEFNFYTVLKQIVGDGYLIFPQVVLASILDIHAGRFETYKYRNPVNRKTLDFVIFDKAYISPLLVIELDDSSHYRFDRMRRDNFVDAVLAKSGIDILHIHNQYTYNIPELTKTILEKLKVYT